MEKVHLNLDLPAETGTDAAELLRDPLVQQLLREQAIPERLVHQKPQRFASWLQNRSVCRGCQGLAQCRQKQTGIREGLHYDGNFLQDCLEFCPYLRQQRARRGHLEHYLICDLGEELKEVRFEAMDLSHEDRAYLNVLKQAMQACQNRQGLYLYGPMGAGKTYLAACAANQLAGQENSVVFAHCPAEMERLRSFRDEEARQELARLEGADFAVFDDIGAEEFNDRTRSLLLAVLDARLQDHKLTWFTSNHDLQTLQQHFLSAYDGQDQLPAMRILDRIRSLSRPVMLGGKNRRHPEQRKEQSV